MKLQLDIIEFIIKGKPAAIPKYTLSRLHTYIDSQVSNTFVT